MTTARAKLFPRIEPWLLDASMTIVLAVTGVVALFVYTDPSGVDYADPDAFGVVLVLAITAPLIVRRRYPVAVGLGTAAGMLAFVGVDYAMPTAAAVLLIAVYSAANYAGLASSLLVTAAHIATSSAYAAASAGRHPEQSMDVPANVVISGLLILGAWGIGRAVRSRRLYTAELEDRARRLERANDVEVRAAIAEERSRIARELHDVVAHHVSVMTVQAAGARRSLHRDVDRTADALAAIEEIGRSALAEMRRVVGVLRSPDGDDRGAQPATLAPQPGLGDLAQLAEQMRDAGLPVDVTIDGEPGAVPVGVDLAAFRVIQEALTNTIKHAGPSTAAVNVRYLPSEVHVEICDDGRGVAAALEGRRPGHGLLGMRERVALYGGTLAAGPRRGGGYEVRAKIPYDGNGTVTR
ncbi:sensor histidine kinase [Jiangella aurantiaca]|uniref:histidine kinase n=1 Tax=Jiangella aurantiaca TaxID=2530373 RepID=A0A4R5A350_9ACTN|nr:sensor histidine kinase [Jiangella aurantiaca]TDD65009.1 sensor histidine kinase [Jiangella aurantiaca]